MSAHMSILRAVLAVAAVMLVAVLPSTAAATNTYVIGGGPGGYENVIAWELMYVPLANPRYTGWGRVAGSHAWCQGGCQASAYQWSARNRMWYRTTRTRADDVYIYPYANGWSWTWTNEAGWLAMRNGDLTVPMSRSRT